MRFRIDLKIFLFIFLFYLTKQIEAYSVIMFFAILHEFGHLVARLIIGDETRKNGDYALWCFDIIWVNTKRL